MARRKPWYLVMALLICSGLGAWGATDAWATIEIYRGAQLDPNVVEVTHEEDRKAVSAALDRMVTAMNSERARAFPLAIGELVLGVAMFVFAAAAINGRGGARRALVQITVAQMLLVAAIFFATPKSRAADIAFRGEVAAAKMVEAGQPRPEVRDRTLPALRVFWQGTSIAALALRAVIAGLIVVALTRPRSRAYYEPQPGPNET